MDTKDTIEEGRVRALMLKGFSKDEISQMMSLKDFDFSKIVIDTDINTNSVDYYSELQRDLSKLFISEMNKDKDNRDSKLLLEAIKLQATLQEKKLFLGKRANPKTSKDYLWDRAREINNLSKEGMSDDKIAEKFNINILTVKRSIDSVNLGLPEDFTQMSPAIIEETYGLEKGQRIALIEQALKENWTRTKMRSVVYELRNAGKISGRRK